MSYKRILSFTAILLVIIMTLGMLTACGGKDAEEPAAPEGGDVPVEEPAGEPGNDPAAEPGEEGIVTLIENIDTEGMVDMPLQIESVTLYEDGTVKIVPTGDLLRNYEDSGMLEEGGIYPFEYIDKVKEIYLMNFGNGGSRTLICLMADGSLYALDAKELIGNHKVRVKAIAEERNDFVDVEQLQDEYALGILGITEGGEEILLDAYLQ